MLSPCRFILPFLALIAATQARAWPSYFESTPFVSGQNGYHTCRIPAIVRATNGTLLAFCEGRKSSASDSGDIDIVLRRSTNNGVTWGPLILVQEEGGNASITIGNPAPVVDESTSYIHLLFCRNNDRVFYTFSTNNGVSWSARDEITSSVKLANWGWYATGPGHGIQLQHGVQAGRLLVSCDHITTNGLNGVQTIYSDDHGATWHLGAFVDQANGVKPNEMTCAEMADAAPDGGSRIYFNARESGSAAGTRSEGWSEDGGGSFTGAFVNQTAFQCPVVEGSLLRLPATNEDGASNRILFSCPNDAGSRVNLSLWSSTNEAATWSSLKTIYPGASAYSDLTQTADGEIALLFEKGDASPYETITFARFNEEWLDSTATAAGNPQPAFWNFEEKSPGQTADTNAGVILNVAPGVSDNDNFTAQKAFSYILAGTNYGNGSALAFDGTGGLQIPDATTANHFDFGATDPFTIEAVFRIPSGSTQTGALVAKDYGTLLPSWWFRIENGRLRFLVCDGNVECAAIAASPLVNDGAWHHAAAVRDTRIRTTKLLRIYLDGVLLTNVVDATTGSLANSQPLNIGRFGNSSTRNLTGDIDMVRITPKALVPSEFLGHWTQFDADGDGIPDAFERAASGSLGVIGLGDLDGDGFGDLLEFTLGTDALSAVSQPQFFVTPGVASVMVSCRQCSLPAWLALQWECSSNLVSWQGCAGSVTLTPLGDGFFQRVQMMPFPSGTPASLYFRMRLDVLP